MNKWANTVVTERGIALLAKLTQGNTLNITEAVTGSGYVAPGLLVKQTGVTDTKQNLTFRPVSYPETGKCAITVALTNDGVSESYNATQVGVYAEDPDEGQILFFIAQSVTETSGTTIPSESEMPGYSSEWTFYLQYGQADGVTVIVDPSNSVTRKEMEEYVASKKVCETITLSAGGWIDNTQEVNVDSVTDSNTVFVSPDPVNHVEYADSGSYCSAQEDGKLTFTCDSVPSKDLAVNVVVIG